MLTASNEGGAYGRGSPVKTNVHQKYDILL